MDEKKITEYLDSLEARGIPSVDCIMMQDHEVVYRHMNGTVNVERTKKVTEDQLYLMYSMTKVTTMTALMQLVEQGKLSLDDEVAKYLPAYDKLTVRRSDGTVTPAKNRLLIWHLASMQSGLDYDLARPGIRRVLKEKGNLASTRELVDAFAESPLNFEPGERYLYSLSHDVVGAIIEVVSGMKLGEYFKKNIFEPLGMNDTTFAAPLTENDRLAAQYVLAEMPGKGSPAQNGLPLAIDGSGNVVGAVKHVRPHNIYCLSESYESGGAGLMSSTADYAKLADTLACGGVSSNGTVILTPASIDTMRTNLLGPASLQDFKNTTSNVGYGYGVGVMTLLDPSFSASPATKGFFGWNGAAGSAIMMDPSTKRSFVFTMHVLGCEFAYAEIHPHLRDLMY